MMELKELLIRAYEIGLSLQDEQKYSFTAEELTEIFRYRYRCRIPHAKYGYKELEDMLDASPLFQRCLGKWRWPLYKCTPKTNYTFKYKFPVRPHYDDLDSEEDPLTSPDINDHDFSLLKRKAPETNPRPHPMVDTGPSLRDTHVQHYPIPLPMIAPVIPDTMENMYGHPNYKVPQWLSTCSSNPSPIPSPLYEVSAKPNEHNSFQGSRIKVFGEAFCMSQGGISTSLESLTEVKSYAAGDTTNNKSLHSSSSQQKRESRLPISPNDLHDDHSSDMDICSSVSHDLPLMSSSNLYRGLCPMMPNKKGEMNHSRLCGLDAPASNAVASATRREEFNATEERKQQEMKHRWVKPVTGISADVVSSNRREISNDRPDEKQRQSRKRRADPATSSNAVPLGSRWQRPDRRQEEMNQHSVQHALPATPSNAAVRRNNWEPLDSHQEERQQHWVPPSASAAASNAVDTGSRREEFNRHRERNWNCQNSAMSGRRRPLLHPSPNPQSCHSIQEFAVRLRDILSANRNAPLSLVAVSNIYCERFNSSFVSDFCDNVAYGTNYQFLEQVSQGEIRVNSDHGLVLFSFVPPVRRVEDRRSLLGIPPRQSWGLANNDAAAMNLYGGDRGRPAREQPLMGQWNAGEGATGNNGNWAPPRDSARELTEAASFLHSLDSLLFHNIPPTFPRF